MSRAVIRQMTLSLTGMAVSVVSLAILFFLPVRVRAQGGTCKVGPCTVGFEAGSCNAVDGVCGCLTSTGFHAGGGCVGPPAP